MSIIVWLLDTARQWHQKRRRVLVLVHKAYFIGNSTPYYFLKATNLSDTREIEITHVWFATNPEVHIVDSRRVLPARLKLDQTWEGWAPAALFPDVPRIERLGRVRLSNDTVVKSRLNRKVPPVGFIAGGGG
jgi:hypothetical protein